MERNAIIAACVNQDTNKLIFKEYFGVHDERQRKKHKSNRAKYLSNQTHQLCNSLYEKLDYYPPAVKNILRQSFNDSRMSHIDSMSKKITRKNEFGINEVFIRRWLHASNPKENHEIFKFYFGAEVLKYTDKIPCAQLLEFQRPAHCIYLAPQLIAIEK